MSRGDCNSSVERAAGPRWLYDVSCPSLTPLHLWVHCHPKPLPMEEQRVMPLGWWENEEKTSPQRRQKLGPGDLGSDEEASAPGKLNMFIRWSCCTQLNKMELWYQAEHGGRQV